MHHQIRLSHAQDAINRTTEFEGVAYGAGVSFFLVDNDPGQGPSLHMHDYPETWIVQSGHARFTLGDAEADFGSGDIVVVSPRTPHRFVNTGPGALKMICIHASERIVNLPI
jgi:mannose-6-phosphate isomerase-like protein (cupin superfamily)